MNLTWALAVSPAGAQSLPACSLNPASVMIAAGGNTTTTVTMNTKAASTNGALNSLPPGNCWKQCSGGGVLALALMFGVPIRRRLHFHGDRNRCIERQDNDFDQPDLNRRVSHGRGRNSRTLRAGV
jgi:hypothetical protein